MDPKQEIHSRKDQPVVDNTKPPVSADSEPVGSEGQFGDRLMEAVLGLTMPPRELDARFKELVDNLEHRKNSGAHSSERP